MPVRYSVRYALIAAVAMLAIVAGGSGAVPSPAALQEQKLTAKGGELKDRFGGAVAVDGKWVVLGAEGDDDLGSGSGAVYLFKQVDSGYEQVAKLTASDGAAGDRFGVSVAIDGKTLVVGAIDDDDNGTSSGAVYIYRRSSGVWGEEVKLTANDAASRDGFGRAVAVDGNTVLIGNEREAVYVFNRISEIWTQQQKLVADDGEAGDRFGTSIAIDGKLAVIGSHGDREAGFWTGAAYIFKNTPAAGWWQQDKLTASDRAQSDYFGYSVAIYGKSVLVGAYGDDQSPGYGGSAYVFRRSEGAWNEEAKLAATFGGELADQFGISVAIDGDTALVGAYWDEEEAEAVLASTPQGYGAIYVFTRSGTLWTQQAAVASSQRYDDFGTKVALQAGSGFVGAPDFKKGIVYVYGEVGQPTLVVKPTSYRPSGPVGGPFTPRKQEYIIENSSGQTVDWRARVGKEWFTVRRDDRAEWKKSIKGRLKPGKKMVVWVRTENAAKSLPKGTYRDELKFINVTSGNTDQVRNVSLRIY